MQIGRNVLRGKNKVLNDHDHLCIKIFQVDSYILDLRSDPLQLTKSENVGVLYIYNAIG